LKLRFLAAQPSLTKIIFVLETYLASFASHLVVVVNQWFFHLDQFWVEALVEAKF
jgi:hypothetical protein